MATVLRVEVKKGVCGGLVWRAEDVYRLRLEWRVIGGLVGGLPVQPRQSGQLGLPLLLSPEELSLLLEKGVVELNGDTPPADDIMSDPEKESRVNVYRDLWERGYTLTSGLKYGADYLVYQGDPTLVHSRFMALVLPWKQPVLTLASLCRVGSKVAKSVLLCSVEQGLVRYQTLEWNPV